MYLADTLLKKLDNHKLSATERANLRSQLAKELEEAGNYEAAVGALGEHWRGVGELPKVDGLDDATSAAMLLRAGALTGWLGSLRQVDGAQESAKNLITKSIELYRLLDDDERIAEAQTDLGYCYWREGDYDAARIILSEAYDRLKESDDEVRGINIYRRAIVENSAGKPQEALRILKDEESFISTINNHAIKGKYNLALGNALNYLLHGDYSPDEVDRTILAYTAATFHFEQAGHNGHRARVENNLGILLLNASREDRARLAEAKEHLERARRIFTTLKDAGRVAQVDESRARALMAEGNDAEAEKAARLSVRTLEKGGENGILAEALITHGTTLARTGEYDKALRSLDRAIEIAGNLENKEIGARARLVMIDELGDRLLPERLRNLYYIADHLLDKSKNRELKNLLVQAARQVIAKHEENRHERREPSSSLIYDSEAMTKLVENAKRLGRLISTVLITGETGVGKEVLARYLHELSGRSGHFVAVNCGAINENLIESELFGHRKGSFTDAVADRPGAVRLAEGGTLFLDEIGELSPQGQAKILRLLESGEVQTVGDEIPERINVRIIAATNRDLQQLVTAGKFRQDLFYRLETFTLYIPPLRERPDDIRILAAYFIEQARDRYGKKITFTDEALDVLKGMPLEGNVRELRSIIERTILGAPEGAVVSAQNVRTFALRGDKNDAGMAVPWAGCDLRKEVHSYEGKLILQALDEARGVVTQAARLLGLPGHQALIRIIEGRHKELKNARSVAYPRPNSGAKKQFVSSKRKRGKKKT